MSPRGDSNYMSSTVLTYRFITQLSIHFHFLQEYLKSDTHGRTEENTSILQVKQGCEPLNFTGYFLAWDNEKWSVS